MRRFALALLLGCVSPMAAASVICPDGSWAAEVCNLCPDGTYHDACGICPDGRFGCDSGGGGSQLCPDGTWHTSCGLCPDGSYGC